MRHFIANPPWQHILFQPQHSFVTSAEGEMLTDDVGRVEEMQASYDRIAQRIGIPTAALEQVNSSSRARLSRLLRSNADRRGSQALCARPGIVRLRVLTPMIAPTRARPTSIRQLGNGRHRAAARRGAGTSRRRCGTRRMRPSPTASARSTRRATSFSASSPTSSTGAIPTSGRCGRVEAAARAGAGRTRPLHMAMSAALSPRDAGANGARRRDPPPPRPEPRREMAAQDPCAAA